jgi:hypothetical protein
MAFDTGTDNTFIKAKAILQEDLRKEANIRDWGGRDQGSPLAIWDRGESGRLRTEASATPEYTNAELLGTPLLIGKGKLIAEDNSTPLTLKLFANT